MKNLLNTELPERFTNAVTKLYDAFYNKTLDKTNCEKCAVGSIVGNRNWSFLVIKYGTYHGKSDAMRSMSRSIFKELILDGINGIRKTGYSLKEIIKIEDIFMNSHVSSEGEEGQFKGLSAVLEYLCELDNIPNIMDYQSLFKEENKQLLNQLT